MPVLFLLPIPVCFGAAVAWAAWVSRPRGPAETAVSVEEYRRALAAMAPRPLDQVAAPADPPKVLSTSR